jgi:hypothetical protein
MNASTSNQPNNTVTPLYYETRILKTQEECAFLWGAIRNALLLECRKGELELIQRLCFTAHHTVKEMMTDVLIAFGHNNVDQVEPILKQLYPSRSHVPDWARLRRQLRLTLAADESPVRNSKKIAVVVAGALGIPQILQRAAFDSDGSIRTSAVQQIYQLWKRDQEQGWAVLELLATRVTRIAVLNPRNIEAVIALSVILFSNEYKDPRVRSQLQTVWQAIIRELLGIQAQENRFMKAIHQSMREQFFKGATGLAFRLLRDIPDYSSVKYDGLARFFSLGPDERARYRRLIQYIDIAGSYTREQMEEDCSATLLITSSLVEYAMLIALTMHTIQSDVQMLPFLDTLAEQAEANPQPNLYLATVVLIVIFALQYRVMPAAMYEYFFQLVDRFQAYRMRHHEIGDDKMSGLAPTAVFLGDYVYFYYQQHGQIPRSWLEPRITAALKDNDVHFFKHTIANFIILVEYHQPELVFEILNLFFDKASGKVSKLIQEFLARLRLQYPQAVEAFMEEHGASEEIRLFVRTQEPVEKAGALIGGTQIVRFLFEAINSSPDLRNRIMRILSQATETKSLEEWLRYGLREILNMVYGADLFPQKHNS